MIEVKVDEDNEAESISYKAFITCPVSECKEKIQIKKIATKTKCGTHLPPKWIYANFKRHLASKHIDRSTAKNTKSQPSIKKFYETTERPTPLVRSDSEIFTLALSTDDSTDEENDAENENQVCHTLIYTYFYLLIHK